MTFDNDERPPFSDVVAEIAARAEPGSRRIQREEGIEPPKTDPYLVEPPDAATTIRAVVAARELEVTTSTSLPVREAQTRNISAMPNVVPLNVPQLALLPDILDAVVNTVRQRGLVGENRNAQLLYLAGTSRVLPKPDRPVSVVIKGTSAAGKSYTMEVVLDLFPPEAWLGGTSMTPKALIYTEEEFKHRILVIYEAAGMSEDLQYILRSLLSEGHIDYRSVRPGNLAPIHIQKEGPTLLFISTTRINLHPENETRMVSISANDTAEQTINVMRQLASDSAPGIELEPEVDLQPWHELQTWIDTMEHRVVIPYGPKLAEMVPGAAVRLRRDFQTVLSLIKAHAILHQVNRARTEDGAIVATIEDYAKVRELVHDLISEGVGKSVKDEVRETVHAVTELQGAVQVTYKALGEKLKLDVSAARRRAKHAEMLDYIKNENDRNQPASLVPGAPLPEDVEVLPAPERLTEQEEV